MKDAEIPMFNYNFVIGFPIWLYDNDYTFDSQTNEWVTLIFDKELRLSTNDVFNLYLKSTCNE